MVRDVIGQLKSISYELDNEDNKSLYEWLTSALKISEQKRKREDLIPLLKKPEPTKKKKRLTNILNFL